MKQEEFLNSFREALVGKVPDSIIRDNENYYRNYINSQMNAGKTEQEVLDQLGDPRLLAKTIEESNKFANGENREFYQDTNSSYRGQDEDGNQKYKKPVKLPTWLISIIAVLVIALIIVVAFSLISFFAPVILAALVMATVYSLIKAWQRRY